MYLLIFFFTAGMCSSKCNVQTNNVEYKHTYYLREVNITIGTEHTISLSICKPSNLLPMDMYIECSSWNKSEWPTSAFTMNCHSFNISFKWLQKRCMNFFILNMLNLIDKYRIINTTDCRGSNAQCDKIDNYCVCHCDYGYIVANEYCVKGNLYCIWFNDFTCLLKYILF